MPVKQTFETDLLVPVKVWTNDIDEASIAQLKNVARLPFVFHHVAAMPDVHAGMGATIGSVIATKGAVIPAAVGVDIGCGMLAARTNLTKSMFDERDLRQLMDEILSRVPVGFAQRKKEAIRWEACEPFEEPENWMEEAFKQMYQDAKRKSAKTEQEQKKHGCGR